MSRKKNAHSSTVFLTIYQTTFLLLLESNITTDASPTAISQLASYGFQMQNTQQQLGVLLINSFYA